MAPRPASQMSLEAAMCGGSLGLLVPLAGFLGGLEAMETPNFCGLTIKTSL